MELEAISPLAAIAYQLRVFAARTTESSLREAPLPVHNQRTETKHTTEEDRKRSPSYNPRPYPSNVSWNAPE